MKKQGFTLLELLAVIVILAIIALITVPIVLKMIENSKQGSAKSGATAYMDSLEKSLVSLTLDRKNIQVGEYKLGSDGNIETPFGLEVKVKGTKANEGKVCINYKGVVVGYSVKVGNLFVTSEDGKKQEITSEFTDIKCQDYANGKEVYFNPVTGKSCSASEAVSTEGTKIGCMKWYAFNDDGTSEKVNLLLDHNTTKSVQYSSSTNCNEVKCNENPDIINSQLQSDTSSWISGLNQRLITMDEIAKITGADNELGWSSSTKTGTAALVWRAVGFFPYGRFGYETADGVDEAGPICKWLNGYFWTSSPVTLDSSDYMYSDYIKLGLKNAFVWVATDVCYSTAADSSSPRGLRPVISVSKSLIK